MCPREPLLLRWAALYRVSPSAPSSAQPRARRLAVLSAHHPSCRTPVSRRSALLVLSWPGMGPVTGNGALEGMGDVPMHSASIGNYRGDVLLFLLTCTPLTCRISLSLSYLPSWTMYLCQACHLNPPHPVPFTEATFINSHLSGGWLRLGHRDPVSLTTGVTITRPGLRPNRRASDAPYTLARPQCCQAGLPRSCPTSHLATRHATAAWGKPRLQAATGAAVVKIV